MNVLNKRQKKLLHKKITVINFQKIFLNQNIKKEVNELYTMMLWLSALHNFIQQCLNSFSAKSHILLATCQRFGMVRTSNNDSRWKVNHSKNLPSIWLTQMMNLIEYTHHECLSQQSSFYIGNQKINFHQEITEASLQYVSNKKKSEK